MATTRVTTSQQARRKAAVAPGPPAAGTAKRGPIAEMASQPAKGRAIDPEAKRLMIAEAAYYRAEKRGFAPGGELQDWLEAEVRLETLLRETR